jgi:CheY-like chemotaxis protein
LSQHLRSEDDCRVLIVEDEEDARDLLQEILEKSGFRVTTARDGAEALGYLQNSRPCLIVMDDIQMPKMDGAEFRRSLLQNLLFLQLSSRLLNRLEQPI